MKSDKSKARTANRRVGGASPDLQAVMDCAAYTDRELYKSLGGD